MTSLIGHTKELFKSRGVPIRRTYSDEQGTYAFCVKLDGETFAVSARKSGWNGQISVMERLVKRAADKNMTLILRVGDDLLVFDPVAFVQHGDAQTRDAKRARRGERWLHVPLDWGCPLESYLSGHAEPQTKYNDLRDFA